MLIINVIDGIQKIPEDKALRKNITQSIDAIKSRPLSDSLTIDMVRLTTFQWDTLYVFSEYNSENFISQAIGASWNNGGTSGWTEEAPDNLLVFMNKGKIVSYVWYEWNGGESSPSFVLFHMHVNNAGLFTPTTAKFIVFRENSAPLRIHIIPDNIAEPIYRPHFNPRSVSRID